MLSLFLLTLCALAGTLQIDVLDIGQGDAILIRSPAGKTVLIDGGEGNVDVVPLLAARGVAALDMVIATHPHADHIGGLDEVVAQVPVKVFVDSGQPHTTATYTRLMTLVEQRGLTYVAARNGRTFTLDDGIVIEVLNPQDSPLRGTRSDLNANSVVTRLTHGANCFLFTGDAEEPTEVALQNKGLTPCKVLKVAHHGSAHSTTDAWLRTVQPEIALISVGEGNRYGHPAQETVDRLERVKATIYRTDRDGTIHLESDGRTVKVSTEQQVHAQIASTLAPEAVPPSTPPSTAPGPRIVLNTASQSDLERIPGIGPARAAAILAYREANGPFTSISQLDNISGIGPATLKNIEAHAVLNP